MDKYNRTLLAILLVGVIAFLTGAALSFIDGPIDKQVPIGLFILGFVLCSVINPLLSLRFSHLRDKEEEAKAFELIAKASQEIARDQKATN